MSNGVILLKRPYVSPNIAPRGSEYENNLKEGMEGHKGAMVAEW